MTTESSGETVSWINVVPLNRREKIARWWVEDVRRQHTYTSARQQEQPFQTVVSVEAINTLASESLRAMLVRQKTVRERGDRFISLPRATPEGDSYFGVIAIPTKPLGATFTSEGIDIDESNKYNSSS